MTLYGSGITRSPKLTIRFLWFQRLMTRDSKLYTLIREVSSAGSTKIITKKFKKLQKIKVSTLDML